MPMKADEFQGRVCLTSYIFQGKCVIIIPAATGTNRKMDKYVFKKDIRSSQFSVHKLPIKVEFLWP